MNENSSVVFELQTIWFHFLPWKGQKNLSKNLKRGLPEIALVSNCNFWFTFGSIKFTTLFGFGKMYPDFFIFMRKPIFANTQINTNTYSNQRCILR